MTDETITSTETPAAETTTETPATDTRAAADTPVVGMSERTTPDAARSLRDAATVAGRTGSRTSVLEYMRQRRCGAD